MWPLKTMQIRGRRIACCGVAFCCASMCPITWAADAGDASQINAAIARADAELAQQQLECRNRFAVTPCVIDARRRHRAVVEPLRRELILIDESRRKQRAAERIDRVRAKSAAASEAAALESDAAPPSASARDAAPLAPAAADAPQQPGIRPTIRANTTTLDEGAASAAGSASASAAVPAADPTTLPRRASKRLTPAPHARSPHEVPDRASAAAQHRERVSRRNAEQDAKKPPSAPLPAAPQAGEQPAP